MNITKPIVLSIQIWYLRAAHTVTILQNENRAYTTIYTHAREDQNSILMAIEMISLP